VKQFEFLFDGRLETEGDCKPSRNVSSSMPMWRLGAVRDGQSYSNRKLTRRSSEEKRELIIDYYVYDGHDKIEHHKLMAGELGITEGALRGRAFHLRATLEKCILKCVENTKAKQKPPSET
jgi:hypothetical protein